MCLQNEHRILRGWNPAMASRLIPLQARSPQPAIFLRITPHLLHNTLLPTESDILFDQNHLHKGRYSILVISKVLASFFPSEPHPYQQSHHPTAGQYQAVRRQTSSLQVLECQTRSFRHWAILPSAHPILTFFTIGMNNPRVNAAWGVAGPIEIQETFLKENLKNKHSFPVIGCWDGKPFGYFEIYWVKEDQLGRHVDSRGLGNWDRGIHVLVGEEGFRGEHRVKVWLSALVHYCWLADQRTENVFLEPRVDNEKLVHQSLLQVSIPDFILTHRRFTSYLHKAGFHKEREFAFPHKQAALMKISRDAWDAPAL